MKAFALFIYFIIVIFSCGSVFLYSVLILVFSVVVSITIQDFRFEG